MLAERTAAGPLEVILFEGVIGAGWSWSQRDEAMAGGELVLDLPSATEAVVPQRPRRGRARLGNTSLHLPQSTEAARGSAAVPIRVAIQRSGGPLRTSEGPSASALIDSYHEQDATALCLCGHSLPKLSNSPFRAPPRNACHSSDVNRRTGPSESLLLRTPILPSGRLATSTQLPLEKLRELLTQ
jgi:hypothetical protein